MKGLIVAYGSRDSQGRDRLQEPRGLLQFGGQSVVERLLGHFEEVGVTETLFLVQPEQEVLYRQALGRKVQIHPYRGPGDEVSLFVTGLKQLGTEAPVIIAPDDEVFDFSLEGLVGEFHARDTDIVAVREGSDLGEDHNFGRCTFDEQGRIVKFSYSFAPETAIHSRHILLGTYLIHPRTIATLNGAADSLKILTDFYRNAYVWLAEGFWADIGKPELRKMAEAHFG